MNCPCGGRCACHTGGPYRPPCDIAGGCGTSTPTDDPPQCGLRCHNTTTAGLCGRCRELTRADLAAIPELWVRLHTALVPTQTAGQQRVTGNPEPPIGVRVDVLSLIGPGMNPHRGLSAAWWASDELGDQTGERPILETLTTWARLVADERHLSGPRPHIAALTTWLLTHHDWATTQPWADDYAHEIRTLTHRARTLSGLYRARPERIIGVPCRSADCDTMSSLYRPAGQTDVVQCGACGMRMTEAEYTRWIRAWHAATAGVRRA